MANILCLRKILLFFDSLRFCVRVCVRVRLLSFFLSFLKVSDAYRTTRHGATHNDNLLSLAAKTTLQYNHVAGAEIPSSAASRFHSKIQSTLFLFIFFFVFKFPLCFFFFFFVGSSTICVFFRSNCSSRLSSILFSFLEKRICILFLICDGGERRERERERQTTLYRRLCPWKTLDVLSFADDCWQMRWPPFSSSSCWCFVLCELKIWNPCLLFVLSIYGKAKQTNRNHKMWASLWSFASHAHFRQNTKKKENIKKWNRSSWSRDFCFV